MIREEIWNYTTKSYIQFKLKIMLRNPLAILLWLCCIFITNSHLVEISLTLEDLETLTAASPDDVNPLNGQHLMVLSFAVSKSKKRSMILS